MLWEKSVVMERERPKVSTLLVKGVKPLHIKDFVNEVERLLDSGGSDRLTDKQTNAVFGYLKFLLQLEKSFSGCSFVVASRGEHYDTNNIKLVTYTYGELGNKLVRAAEWGDIAPRIYVYVPTNRYVSGWVSLGDFRKGDHNDSLDVPRIGIFSQHIGHPVIGKDSFHHAIKTTTKVKTALSVARKFFRMENAAEIALRDLPTVKQSIADQRADIETLVFKAKAKFVNHNRFPELMKQLLSTNDAMDENIKQELQEYVTELNYQQENVLTTNIGVLYVRGYVSNGRQMFDRVRLHTKNSNVVQHENVFAPCEEEDLPEEVKRKLSLLMMEEDKAFIANVGYKLDDEIYYIYE